MAGRVLVRKKNLQPTNPGTKPLSDKVFRKGVREQETCNACYYPSWQCHTKAAKFRSPKFFSISQKLVEASAPTVFESHVIEKKVYDREVFTTNGYKAFYKYLHTREWVDKDGSTILDQELKQYDWRWTGHFNTYTGRIKSKTPRLAKRGIKSDQKNAPNAQPDSEACPF